MNFRNQAYTELVTDLIGDAFYIEGRSNRGVISTIRQYAEVVIRKILDLPVDERLTLGDRNITCRLEDVSNDDSFLMMSVDAIRRVGNDCTHTQQVSSVSDAEVDSTIENLLNLYSYLFILHFRTYTFGSNNDVMAAFSILPPIIRYLALNQLYEIDKSNLSVIDKLSLVLLKAFDVEAALKWIEDRKEELSVLLPYTSDGIKDIERVRGKLVAEHMVANAPKNMYVLCLDRVKEVSAIIAKEGLLYNSFEQAKSLYLEKGVVTDLGVAGVVEFNSIMEFVYLGRKTEDNPKLGRQHLYNILK